MKSERTLADASEDADARVVDRLLASEAYGERFARKWLDVARYADSNGVDENLAFADAWRYRDWVVRALNADLPYDRFIAMQIAGDVLGTGDESDGERRDRLTATGFLALGPKMLRRAGQGKTSDGHRRRTNRRRHEGVSRSHGVVRPLPRPQVRSGDGGGLLRLGGVFRSTRSFANLDFVSRWHSHDLSSKDERETRLRWEKDRAGNPKRRPRRKRRHAPRRCVAAPAASRPRDSRPMGMRAAHASFRPSARPRTESSTRPDGDRRSTRSSVAIAAKAATSPNGR
jgi:hypothetical protein